MRPGPSLLCVPNFFIFSATIVQTKTYIDTKGGETVEQKWIRAIQRHGSRQAAEQLVEAYYDEMYRFAYRQTGNKEDAMDLTQDIFLAVLRALPSYDRRRAGFRTWLYRVAANKAVDARRRFGPATVPMEEVDIPAEEDFVGNIQNRVLLEQVERWVAGQDTEAQAVFRLHLYGEKTFPEIAAILDKPESAVKSQYYRLLGRLRKEFDPCE